METKKYNVFISYSRKDYVDEQKNVIPGNVVSTIKERLTAEGITYWFDEEGIYSGQNFIDKIVTNIELSQIFVFLSTANSNNSHWTCKEIASADEFGKHIIPVRVDKTPYNKKVMFRIADLSYIEYYTNPEKGLNDLVASIKSHIEQIEAENRRKREEVQKREEEKKRLEEAAKKKKFEEEMRLQKEQEKVIADIKLKCTKLNNEETKLELDRENLLLSAERIFDKKEKKSLTDFIIESSPIRIKCSKEKEELQKEITESQLTIEKLNKQISEYQEQISTIKKEKGAACAQTKELNKNNGEEKKKNSLPSWAILIIIFFMGFIIGKSLSSHRTEDKDTVKNQPLSYNISEYENVDTVNSQIDLRIACVNSTNGSIRYFKGNKWNKLSGNHPYRKIGLYFRADNKKEFIIAAEDCSEGENFGYKFGGYGTDFRNVENYDTIASDVNTGYEDTKAIIEQSAGKTDRLGTSGTPAAEAAWNYKANENDPMQWYLPSITELKLIYKYKKEINTFLSEYFLYANKIFDDWYWSSTEYYSSSSWVVNMSYGGSFNGGRYHTGRVRAVCCPVVSAE